MIKNITLLYFLLLSVSSLAQNNIAEKEEWKEIYKKYTQSDISLTMHYKSIEVENDVPITIDSGTVEFYKKGKQNLYQDNQQKIITTTDYLLYISEKDSLLVLNTQSAEQEEKNTIKNQWHLLDSLIDNSPLQVKSDETKYIFILQEGGNTIEIYITKNTKEIIKINYFNTFNTARDSYTEVIYTETLFSPVFESNFFSIDEYLTQKRKKWALTKKYNNYTLIAE